MFLKPGWAAAFQRGWLVIGLVMQALLVPAQADWGLKSSAQVGVDAWHLSSSAQDQPGRRFLWMANANTRWDYQDAAPWYTLQSHLRNGAQGEWVLRSRGSQGYGGALDELSYAHFVSHALGLRAGILDYRATWCRTYDLDNPWVRENDPFCTDRFTSLATASAPALQVYTHVDVGDYQVQGLLGWYRPKALGYEPREFSGLVLADSARVTQNRKQVLSLNAINSETATEWRLSWIGTDQRLFESAFMQMAPLPAPASQLAYEQRVSTYFAGVSWLLAPQLRSRLTHLRGHIRGVCELMNPAAGEPCANQFHKSSSVWELSYQLDPSDVLSLAISQHGVRHRGEQGVPVYQARNRAVSLGWRRDWPGGWFNAWQLTRSMAWVPYQHRPWEQSYLPGRASAWGLGLRAGYQW